MAIAGGIVGLLLGLAFTKFAILPWEEATDPGGYRYDLGFWVIGFLIVMPAAGSFLGVWIKGALERRKENGPVVSKIMAWGAGAVVGLLWGIAMTVFVISPLTEGKDSAGADYDPIFWEIVFLIVTIVVGSSVGLRLEADWKRRKEKRSELPEESAGDENAI